VKGRVFAPGFRISVWDAVVLCGGALGAWWLYRIEWWIGVLLAWVVGHFFLFCNVFRISRGPELIWAAVFVLLCASRLLFHVPGWMATFLGSVLVAMLLIALEMVRPCYHGIGWQKINPTLPEWWKSKGTQEF